MLLLAASFLLFSAAADEKRISIYSSSASYTLAVTERNGQDYVGLRETLEPLGRVSVKTDGLHWRLRYNGLEGDFTAGKTRARIHGQELELPANFLLESGRGLVPLTSLGILLSRFLDSPIAFHANSRRLFIGSVAVHFTAQINRTNRQSLVVNFTAPVNPMIATEPGRLRMVFTRDPLVPPGSETLTFDSRAIPSATYAENNGVAELAVVGSVPLLATFSNDRRTITITPAPQTARAVPQAPNQMPAPFPQAPAQQAGMPSAASTPAAGGTATNALPLQYFAVVDASHGGDERGAALGAGLAEKDVTLALARRLRQELAGRGLTALVLRDGDITLSPDQRANLANTAYPAVYICLHATSEGMGVRVYTALRPVGSDNRGSFLDWDSAQSAFRPTSQAAAASVVAELRKRQVTVRSLLAPLRPLNNVTAAAIAIEVAPQAGGTSELNSPAYQELVAESVAAGIANLHDKLGGPR